MAIRKSNNKVEIGGLETPFGGEVVDLSYSVNYSSSPSSITLTIANSTGEYDEPQLNSEDPMLVKFGNKRIQMLPVAYKKSGGTSARTLSVEFDDMSLKYLDKTFILLNNKHVSELSLPRVIHLGNMFIEGSDGTSGELVRYFGQYRSDVEVKYDIRELAQSIRSNGIPMSKAFYNFLTEFKAYKLTDDDRIVNKSFSRGDTGTLRDVLSAIAGELGFVFFWNNDDNSTSVYNYNQYEGYLDFVKMEDDIDIENVRASILKYTDNCNIEDDTEEVSIRGSYIKGAIGSFSVSPSSTKSKSEPFARFRFMDNIYSPYTGNTFKLAEASVRQKYDLELLMKASLVSEDFYRKFVLLKLIAQTFDTSFNSEIYRGVKSKNIEGRNQEKNSGQQKSAKQESEIIGKWFWPWKNIDESDTSFFPLNITRNSVVEKFYDFGVHPAVLSKDTEVKEATKSDGWNGEAEKGIRADNTSFGKDINKYINSKEDFILGLRDNQPRWVACIMDKTPIARRFLKGEGEDPLYTKIKFLAQNFGRFYYSVERTNGFSSAAGESNTSGAVSPISSSEDFRLSPDADLNPDVDFSGPGTFGGTDSNFNKSPGTFSINTFTERPSLFLEKVFSERSYSNGSPTFVFSDLAATDGALKEVYNLLNLEDDQVTLKQADFTTSNYYMVKNGQSQSPIVLLPSDVASPATRYFTVDGYDNIISTYGMIRYLEDPQIKPVRHTSVSANEDYVANSQFFLATSEYKGFKTETLGVTSSQAVPVSSSSTDFTQRGSTLPVQTAGSMSQKSYEEIKTLRSEGEDEIYTYPSNLDYGILLYDAYSENEAPQEPQLNLEFQFITLDTDESDFIKTDMKFLDKEIFVIELPLNKPSEVTSGKEVWGGSIYPDDIDKEVLKINLPFTLAEIRNRIRLNYSYNVEDILTGVRTSYIPEENFEKVTSVDIEDVNFDISDLLDTSYNVVATEFPLKDGSNVEANIPLLTQNLKEIMRLYVDENTAPSLSRDFRVTGFGFGDNDDVPSIDEGLESISVSIGDNGVSTTIKIGNKRRTKESIDLRRSLLLRELAGSKAGKLVTNQVTKTFSNKLLSRF